MDRNTIAEQLQKPLGPEYVSFKTGHAYLEGHKAVALANEIFGFDGWSSEIKKIEVDYSEETNRKFSVSANCIMRVTTKSGSFREDVGFGSSINMPSRFQAFEKARKEAATDALKRALRQFGESLGNCLYNREYIDVVKRTKPEKLTFDQDDMRRPKKKMKLESGNDAQHKPTALQSGGQSGALQSAVSSKPTGNPASKNHLSNTIKPILPQSISRPYQPAQLSTSSVPLGMHSTPVERPESTANGAVTANNDAVVNNAVNNAGHKPPPQLPSSDDEAPPDFDSDVVFESDHEHTGFTSGAGYDDAVETDQNQEPYDVSKSVIHSTRVPQDRSSKVFK